MFADDRAIWVPSILKPIPLDDGELFTVRFDFSNTVETVKYRTCSLELIQATLICEEKEDLRFKMFDDCFPYWTEISAA